MKSAWRPTAIIVFLASALALRLDNAEATEGYFQHGYGARQKALGGAGVADSRDATAVALNPAGLVNVDDQANIAVSAFRPLRGFDGSGEPGLTPEGDVDSGRNFFFIPNLAWSHRLSDDAVVDAIGLSVYANGGLNTEYPPIGGSPTCRQLHAVPASLGGPIGTGTGIFCNGSAGIDLQQAFVSMAFAKRVGSVSLGVAPIFALQLIDVVGLRLFTPFSVAPTEVSDNGRDISYGGGLRAGIEIKLAEGIRVGVAGNSRIWMSEFDSYRGLFADAGDFDIPPSIQAGFAIDVNQHLTVMLDYKRIWYSSIESIANPSIGLQTAGISPSNLLGAPGGPGFGWGDIDIIKLGAEWRVAKDLCLRAGYAANEGPFSSRDVMVNILAPGIVRHHFTAGLSYAVSDNWLLDLAGFYSPRETVDGAELGVATPLGAVGNPRHRINLHGQGGELTIGLTYKFDPVPGAIE